MSLTTLTDLSAEFKDAMAHMCAPVTVITTSDGQRPLGTTVSALMSLSAEPLLIAVSMAATSESLAAVIRAGRFGVNVLGADQTDTAMRFAVKGDDKFTGVDWHDDHDLPRIVGAPIWIACRLDSVLPGGDHRILVGAVEAVETDTEARPLTYHGRRFGTHVTQDPS